MATGTIESVPDATQDKTSSIEYVDDAVICPRRTLELNPSTRSVRNWYILRAKGSDLSEHVEIEGCWISAMFGYP